MLLLVVVVVVLKVVLFVGFVVVVGIKFFCCVGVVVVGLELLCILYKYSLPLVLPRPFSVLFPVQLPALCMGYLVAIHLEGCC